MILWFVLKPFRDALGGGGRSDIVGGMFPGCFFWYAPRTTASKRMMVFGLKHRLHVLPVAYGVWASRKTWVAAGLWTPVQTESTALNRFKFDLRYCACSRGSAVGRDVSFNFAAPFCESCIAADGQKGRMPGWARLIAASVETILRRRALCT